MKTKKSRKIAAVLAAFTLLTSAVPGTAFQASAAGNIISNSTFESGTSGWGTYKESGGACSLSTENGKLALTVSDVGKVNYAVQVFYDIVPLYQNGVYRLKFDISCSTDRFIEAMIQQNGGTYQAYTWKGLNLTSTPQTVDYEFTMKEETDIMAKLVFNCGIQEKYEGALPEHKIYLDNVSLELVDDSNVDYAASRPYAPSINVNQVGYRPDSRKTAVFRDVTSQSQFTVINAETNAVAFTGNLSAPVTNSSADETNYIGDFSKLTTPGKYYVKCDGLDDSYTFTIGENVYNDLLDDSVRMLYLQRCGVAVQDKTFAHSACHTSMATIYGTNQQIDVSGGWHDAGDYGRYIVPAAKAVADLLYAYQNDPAAYSDSIGIPESGNGTPDILDEARFELEWMKKMQASNGGVYHKVSCETFPGYVMPEDETKPLIVTPISTTATADFCGAMALAYEFYKDVDSTFANDCLDRAKSAWAFLEANPNFIFQNPEDIVTGEYGDKSDRDERYWAAAQLYRATGDAKYLSAISTVSTGLDWATVGDYGNIALLTMKNIDKTSTAYQNALSAVKKQADNFVKISGNAPYGSAISKYEWGSNMTIANAGIILGLAYQLTGDEGYKTAAEAQLDYLLGQNPVSTCFVTGYGTVSPETPHHRPSMAKNQAMKGMLVGGVNQNLEDSAAKAYCQDLANAKRYVDNSESYSTNEITIYWNSPLTYLLTLTDTDVQIDAPVTTTASTAASTTTTTTTTTSSTDVNPTQTTTGEVSKIIGDANLDGQVTIADATAILQHLGNKDKYGLEPQGLINGDVNSRGDGISSMDAVTIQMYDAKVITVLPESLLLDPADDPADISTTAVTEQPAVTTTTDSNVNNGIIDYGTPMNVNATAIADFRKGETPLFFASDGWTNGSCFDCFWYKENTSLANNMLSLTIDTDPKGKYHYSAAEYRTADHYDYGYYETSMQAIKNPGVVSSFFTYTGPSEDNPWDEIDIEVLGKDTTKVQFNYYTNSAGNHEFMYDLGFDASEGFHTYGFDWQPDHITWFVDGKAVHTVTENIPSTPGRIMMNVWPGTGVDGWLAPFDGKTPLTARYQWVTYNNYTNI